MSKKNNSSNMRVFSDSFKMETETIFHEDGRISTLPCAWELGQQITANGGTVKLKAKVTIDPDGNTDIMPYQSNSGTRYKYLFFTTHGEAKETQDDIIVKFQFKKSRGRYKIAEMLAREVNTIIEYMDMTNDVKGWQ